MQNNQVDYAAIDQTPQTDDDGYKRAQDEADEQLCGGVTKFQCFRMSWCLVQLVALIMGALNIFAITQIMSNDYSDNTTIYTQAIEDWTQKPWVDFEWVVDKYECPKGYESIGIDWLGTHRGNVTDIVWVVPDESRFPYDVDMLSPVKQSSLYSDMKDGLCGKRGGQPHLHQVRADITHSCAQGWVPCTKRNQAASGFATCVQNKDECPVTEIMIYTDAEKPSQIDSRFTVKASSGTGAHKLNLAFTKEAITTHTAVQQISWQLGQPCAFTNQHPVTSADQTPRHYALERGANNTACQKFIFQYQDGSIKNQIAADDRYINQGKISDLPNMATVQELSGVKEQLAVMPFFYRDMGTGVWDRRSKFKYNFWTRSTIDYMDERCEVSQGDAIIILQDMKDAGSKENLTMGVIVSTCIYLVVSSACCYSSGNDLFFKEEELQLRDIKLRTINVAGGTFVVAFFGFINFIVATINFKRIIAETSAMSSWDLVDGCVDKPYMTLSEHESISVSTIDAFARVSLALSILIMAAQCIMACSGCFYISKQRND